MGLLSALDSLWITRFPCFLFLNSSFTVSPGFVSVTGLQAGAYVVEELASDSGHIVDAAPQTAYISGKQQDVVQLYFGNSPKSSLLITKVDSSFTVSPGFVLMA